MKFMVPGTIVFALGWGYISLQNIEIFIQSP